MGTPAIEVTAVVVGIWRGGPTGSREVGRGIWRALGLRRRGGTPRSGEAAAASGWSGVEGGGGSEPGLGFQDRR
jgi:hypothetical protein